MINIKINYCINILIDIRKTNAFCGLLFHEDVHQYKTDPNQKICTELELPQNKQIQLITLLIFVIKSYFLHLK